MTATESLSLPAGLVRTESRATIEAENWKLLRLFNFYRLAIALAASGVALTAGSMPPFGSSSQDLFLFSALVYLLIGVITLVGIQLRKPEFDIQAALLGFADIALLTMLMHASGGIASGAGLLLLVSIAGISLMLERRDAVFYASLATIAILLEHGWESIGLLAAGTATGHEPELNFPQVGLYGIGLLVTAFISYTLARRLRATEALAERRGVDLANLAQINELIIQRLQSGVLVCDSSGHVKRSNQPAQKFLGLPPDRKDMALNVVAPDLAIQLFQWLSNDQAHRTRQLFRTRRNYTLLPRFVMLGENKDNGVLVFLDDMAILKQQAQQLKMAALARLTASIAHEIRNPLGALSNAAQLLGETAGKNAEEKRLIQIIDEQSRRMNIIVQNVTQLSRRDRVNPARILLDTWLAEFTRQYADTVFIPHEAFTRQPVGRLTVCFDPEQLYQVVSNLCQNALRASPPFSGTPLVRFHAGQDAEGRPYLDVIDWGKGVPPEIVDNIFDPFFTTTPKGTGLGLYIARELCEGNGGELGYRPGEGGVGSVFRVNFTSTEDCLEPGAA
jgi:two-component system sensor histidine kinase PilS (NtrC family)